MSNRGAGQRLTTGNDWAFGAGACLVRREGTDHMADASLIPEAEEKTEECHEGLKLQAGHCCLPIGYPVISYACIRADPWQGTDRTRLAQA